MADPTALPKPHHHLLAREGVEFSASALYEDVMAADSKSKHTISSDNGVDEPADGVSMPMSQTGETTHTGAESTAVPLQQYEDLVTKFHNLEDMLARVDKVVQKELVDPLAYYDKDPYLDMSNDEDDWEDPSKMDSYFIEYLRNQNMLLRENHHFFRMMRHHWNSQRRQRRKRANPEVSIARDEAMATAKAESQARTTARLAEMLASGTPATCLRTTWGEFAIIQRTMGSMGDWREDRRKESLVHPFELLTGEVESSLVVGSRERKPTPRSMPPTTGVKAHGEAPLPERIIFHSNELTHTLNFIQEAVWFDPGNGLPGNLRPFKSLVFYESELRDYATKLEAEVADHDKATADNTSANLSDDDRNGSDASDTESETSISTSGDARKRDASIRLLHIRCLLDFIDDEIKPKQEYLRSRHCEKVTFSDLWYLFQPGVEVVDQDNKQAYRVVRVMMPKHNSVSPWEHFRSLNEDDGKGVLEKSAKIHCIYIDFDGEKLGPVSKIFKIPQFDQEKPIGALPIRPLEMVREAGFREQLVERGKMLWEVIQVKPMYYNGHTIDTREEADSQVMIDFGEALIHAEEHEKDWKPRVGLLPTSLGKLDARKEDTHSCSDCCYGQAIMDDSYVEVKQAEDFIKSQLERNLGERPSLMIYPQMIGEFLDTKNSPSREELVLMSYRAFGFILRSRKWAQLDLAYMKYENEASRTEVLGAFDRLILPDGHKAMVQSLVTQHFREKRAKEKNADFKRPDAKTDLIRGKGQGLIILLHGAPGVGKTTTAEGIAETFKKPLFQITSGDLGTTASEVQEELEKNFTLASRWDCILLLDEAEVFLASRDRKDFQRNGLVAVFLRVLEYYTGVLFLTTNRVGDFDEAFASRIQMSLHYPKLDLEKTLKIFKVNMQLINNKFELQQRNIFLDEDSIIEFARKHFTDNDTDEGQDLLWNGRQIRNACQTALAMAEFEALDGSLSDELEPALTVQLKLKHFHIIEAAYNDFATYLGDTYGVTQSERMAEGKVRAVEPSR